MNTRQQGAIGVAAAISYFTSEGYIVCVPISEAQRYDLIVDKDGIISRVEVKRSAAQPKSTSYEVGLRTMGGNRSNGDKATFLSESDCDLVFICCGDGSQYLFPISVLAGRSSVSLPGRCESYRV